MVKNLHNQNDGVYAKISTVIDESVTKAVFTHGVGCSLQLLEITTDFRGTWV